MGRYRDILYAKLETEREEERRQEILHRRYDIDDEDVVVVEKNHFIKFFITLFIRTVQFVALLCIFCLTAAGILALVYPEPRRELLEILEHTIWEITDLISRK